jgi:hypothetical protein
MLLNGRVGLLELRFWSFGPPLVKSDVGALTA